MPNTESSKKRVRQTEKRTFRNKERRTSMRTFVRKVNEAIEAGDKGTAQTELVNAYRAIDKCAKANIIHDNTAANHKAKLTKRVNKL